MRAICLSLLAIVLNVNWVLAADGEGKWYTNLAEAQKVAAAEKKDLLVNFTGSDWCIWCIRLKKEVFSQSEFVKSSKEFIWVEIDFPRNKPQSPEEKKTNRDLAEKYDIKGYPTILLMNANGEVYAKTGYKPGGAEKYVQELIKLKQNQSSGASK